MNPYFEDEDFFFIRKFAINPHRYDIISFKDKNGNSTVKRVYGLPGERLEIKVFKEETKIFINGVAIDDKYASTPLYGPYTAATEIELDKDEYFVLGDNRNYSLDSRYEQLGLIRHSDIIGIMIYP